MLRRSIVLASAMCLTACAGARSPLAQKNPFPAREKLEALAGSRASLPKGAATKRSVPGWRIETKDVPTGPSAVEARVAASPGGGELRFVPELRCAARELARFHAENGAEADERVQRYVLGACGYPDAAVTTNFATATLPAGSPEAELLSRWTPALSPALRGAEAGAALARKGDDVVVVVASGRRKVEVEVTPPDASGAVVLRGVLTQAGLGQGEVELVGYVNQGREGVARCELEALPSPHVSFRCPMAPADRTAWIEVLAQPKERLLARSVATVLARRDDAPVELAPSETATRKVTAPKDLSAAVLEGVNAVRSRAGQRPLVEARAESAVADKLAGHFFVAELTSDAAKADLVALGLLAGYDVQGVIRNGSFYAGLLGGTDDATRFVDYALELPSGRVSLLAPSARAIAIGSVVESGALAAVATTYALFEGEDHAREVDEVHAQIVSARAKKGLRPQRRIPASKATLAAVARVRADGDAMGGLERVLSAELEATGRGVRAWVFTASELGALPFPKEVLEGDAPLLGVQVTHARAPEGAWGTYVVYIFVAQPGAGTTAASPAPRGPRAM